MQKEKKKKIFENLKRMNISLFFDRVLLVPVITNSFQTPDLEL